MTTTYDATDMPLVGKTRLSVQPVSSEAWNTIEMLASRGGWSIDETKSKSTRKQMAEASENAASDDNPQIISTTESDHVDEDDRAEVIKGRKRKAKHVASNETALPTRRSTRRKT
jgi:hypothetical protein